GNYTFNATANDTAGNNNGTGSGSRTVLVRAFPVLSYVTPTPANASLLSYPNISINVTSDVNLSVARLYIDERAIDVLGDGGDGALTVTGASTIINNYTYLTANASIGDTNITVNSASGFSLDDEILIIQTQNSSNGTAGTYEFATIVNISGSVLELAFGLDNVYFTGVYNSTTATNTQVITVPQYTNLTVNSGASIVPRIWEGTTGGIIVFKANENVNVVGNISANGAGFRGGEGTSSSEPVNATQGESFIGLGLKMRTANRGGGGGHLSGTSCSHPGAGGGGHGAEGGNGSSGNCAVEAVGQGGNATGTANLSVLMFGGGGGEVRLQPGADGGGIVFIAAQNISVTGRITANGNA
ncbi:MAG: hypothetical protein AABW65_02725, partial [Nanoarchaeota archaeon]